MQASRPQPRKHLQVPPDTLTITLHRMVPVRVPNGAIKVHARSPLKLDGYFERKKIAWPAPDPNQAPSCDQTMSG